jgi:photosystem II stability/assembly factor-like uncharacterized protein
MIIILISLMLVLLFVYNNTSNLKYCIMIAKHVFQRSILLLSIVLLPFLAFPQWGYVNTTSLYSFYGLSTSGSNIFLGGSGIVMVSNNNGLTWTTHNVVDQSGTSLVASYMYGLHFFNGNTGVGTGVIASGNSECMLRTTNGATNWVITNSYNGGPILRYMNDLYFVNSSDGFAAGTNGRILKTSDGGLTWTSISSGSIEWKSIWFTSPMNGYVVGNNTILKTTDGGSTWQPTTVSGNLTSVSFGSPMVGFASGGGVFYRTIDGGIIWTLMPEPFSSTGAVYAVNQDTVYLAADQGIAISRDAGISWEKFTSITNSTINNILFTDETHGWACGNLGDVFKTVNGGGSSAPISYFTFNLDHQCGYSVIQLNNIGALSNSYKWYINGVLQSTDYNINDTVYTSGYYLVSLVANNGTDSNTMNQNINVNIHNPITANAGDDLSLCFSNSAQIQATGGSIYSWSPTTGLSNPNISNPVFNLDTSITYILMVTDADGICNDQDTLFIHVNDSIPQEPWTQLNVTTANPITAVDFINPNVGIFVQTNYGRYYKTMDGGESWTSYYTFAGYSHSDVDFVDEDVVYIANHFIYKSFDGGLTFYQQGTMLADGVFFFDRENGYAFCSSCSPGSNGIIYKTTNGGVTWENQGERSTNVYALDCLNMDTCFCVGGGGVNLGKIWRTTNGGQQWIDITPTGFSINTITNLLFINDSVGFAGNLKTEDLGQTWTETSFGPRCMFFTSTDTGYAAASPNKMFRTINGGDCWQYYLSGLKYTNEIFFVNSKVGYMCGGENFSTIGKIYKTVNGRDISFHLSDTNICINDTVSTMNTSFGNDDYIWLLNGTIQDTAFNYKFVFATPGTYQISLVGIYGSERDTALRMVTVIDPGLYSFPQQPDNITICEGMDTAFSVQISGPITNIHWQWKPVGYPTFIDVPENAIFHHTDSTTLEITNAPAYLNGFQFQCMISTCLASNIGILNVIAKLNIINEPQDIKQCFPVTSIGFSVGVNGTGLSYQWQMDDGAGFVNLSNNSTFSGVLTGFLQVYYPDSTMDGYKFRCIINDICQYQDTSNVALAYIATHAIPYIYPSDSVFMCPGDTVLFSVSPTPGYCWLYWYLNNYLIPGTTHQSTYYATQSGNYYVERNNACGSFNTSVVNVSFGVGNPAITANGPLSSCEGDTITLNATPVNPNFSYQWLLNSNVIPGAISNEYSALQNGTYSININSDCGNDTSSPAYLNFYPVPIMPVITQTGFTLTSSAASGNQWYDSGGAITGETGQTFTVTYTDSFYTIVTENGCSSEPSNIIHVSYSGIEEFSDAGLFIYPNPVTGALTIVANHSQKMVLVEIYNCTGQKTADFSMNHTYIFDFSNYPSGIYRLVMKTDDQVFSTSVIKD